MAPALKGRREQVTSAVVVYHELQAVEIVEPRRCDEVTDQAHVCHVEQRVLPVGVEQPVGDRQGRDDEPFVREPAELLSQRVHRGGRRTTFGSLRYDGRKRAITFDIPGLTDLEVPVEHLPWHCWDFDFSSLNLSLRHLRDPEGRFSVAVAGPP